LDDAEAREVTGQVKFTLTNFGILAAVRITARLQLICARCIDPFETTSTIIFDEEFQPVIDIVSGLPVSAPQNDTASMISSNHVVDLSEAIRQNLLLSMEIIPLCTPNCRGLCPNCGANRNQETCDCPPAEQNSPFAVLQGLLIGTDSNHS
jgi:uncharacterized protein